MPSWSGRSHRIALAVNLWFNFSLTNRCFLVVDVRETWHGFQAYRELERGLPVSSGQSSRGGSGGDDRARGTGNERGRSFLRLEAAPADVPQRANRVAPKAKSVIYIFLSGGLSQLESFDLKPNAPADIRGEFRPIATRTPGIAICEHLPRLAQRSHLWALVRSLTHGSNDHSAGHHIMLTGRSDLPSGFDPNRPRPGDWPSIAAVAGALTVPRNNLSRRRSFSPKSWSIIPVGSFPASSRARWGRAATHGSSKRRRSIR